MAAMFRTRDLLVLIGLAGACTPAPNGPADTPETAGDGQETGGESGETGDGETDPGPFLDLGGHDGPGCAKVDLLFVIDNSVSMASEHGNLIASFPEFIASIDATLDGADSYHVGVITTDAYQFNHPDCRELGALVTQTGGAGSSDAVCGPFSGPGGRFMTEAEDLAASFACAGQVGLDGSNDERPMEAMERALGEALAEGCNAGFLRDDALLVLVVITDEEDDPVVIQGQQHGSSGDPPDWFAAVAERKGVESNAVVLMIVGGLPDNTCPFPTGSGAKQAPRLVEFTEMFTHGFLGDVCAWSYGPFFSEAVEVIDSACENFVPVP